MQVIFSDDAHRGIISEAFDKMDTETGGVLLGRYENDTWYIIETIEPGPKAVFQEAYFEYDREYVECKINRIAHKYQAELTLIGMWHKHLGSYNEFSSTDDITNSEYAKMSENGAISILVNVDPNFRITPYHVAVPFKYTRIECNIGDELVPERLLRLEDVQS